MSGMMPNTRRDNANAAQICSLRSAWEKYSKFETMSRHIRRHATTRGALKVGLVFGAVCRAYLARYCELERADLAYAGVLDFEVLRDPRRLIDISTTH